MTKSEIIERIRKLNRTADREFLDSFENDELLAYLHQLQEVDRDSRRKGEFELALTE